MKIGLVVPGGVDPSGRDRVVPVVLWLIERLARRHDLHVFVVDYYPKPCSYDLLGAHIHDLGRVIGPSGFRRLGIAWRLAAAVHTHGPFDVLHAYWGVPAGIVTHQVGRRLGIPAVVTVTGGWLGLLGRV